jgi:putative ABC transport system permease protein
VTETVLLFVGGAVAALFLAAAASRAISAFRPPVDVPLSFDVPLDWRVFVFALVVAVVVGAVFGLLPGLRSTRSGVASVLKEEAGTVSGRSRMRSAVVMAQVAFTFLLLAAAGLMVRALGGALRLDPGFDRANVHVAMTDLQMARLDSNATLALANGWRDAVAGQPGVTGAALVTRAPLSSGNSTSSFKIEGGEGRYATEFQSADWAGVSPDFFGTLGIRLIAGRSFSSADTYGSSRVSVVSEAFAKKYFGSADRALGRVLQFGTSADSRSVIVGVAADTKVRSLDENARPMLYDAIGQGRIRNVTIVARGSRPDLESVMRNELRRLNSAVPLMGTMSYDQFIGIALLPQRMAAVVSAVLGVAGLLLAIVGVYGLVAYSVSQRTREIGIRMAVGATPSNVVSTFATGGLRLVAIGIGGGLLLSLASTRLMRSFLLGVSPTDPMILGGITLGLAALAMVACAIPASRAARVDPLIALRSE